MRYAVVADVHGNLEAFRSVVDHARRNGGFDWILCLGDVVGYGPNPHECLELLRRHRHVCVSGNHDMAAAGLIDSSAFNQEAAAAVEWTSRCLTDEDRAYLKGLRVLEMVGSLTLVHGSPRNPEWEYISSPHQAEQNLPFLQTPCCLVGHTHVPRVYRCRRTENVCVAEDFMPDSPLHLSVDRMFINPGSVGQPRDGVPAAAYALIDADEGLLTHFRVGYPMARTQDKMMKAGLPSMLIRRLSYGF